MKNKKIMVLVALAVALVGLIGVIICVLPGQTATDKMVSKYVKAINAGDTEAIYNMSASAMLTDSFNSQWGDLFGNLPGNVLDGEKETPADKVYAGLQKSVFNASDCLPTDFKQVKSVKVVGCVEGEEKNYSSMPAIAADVVLEITYVDAEDNTQTVTYTEGITVVKYRGKRYIAA